MKKLVSIILAVMMAFAMSINVFAENLTPGEYLFESSFYEQYIEPELYIEEIGYGYDECYYHHTNEFDSESPIDWVYVYAFSGVQLPWLSKRVVADRIFYRNSGSVPFEYGYGIYDVEADSFFEITEDMLDNYEDLRDKLDELNIGTPIGDADGDNNLSIMDCTYVQRVAAKICDYLPDDDISGYHNLGEKNLDYISDADFDGERTIMDATAIQFKLAKVDEEPVVNEEMVYADFNNMYGVDTGIETVDFGVLYNGIGNFENKIGTERFAVIIKSKEQFDYVFSSNMNGNGGINDDLFEDKWVVASACRVTDAQMVADITDLGVRYKTLFIRADKVLENSNGVAQPLAPMYYSFVFVDKNDLAQVNEIIWL